MFSRIIKGISIIVFTTILATLAINAGDNVHNFSNSLLATILQTDESLCPDGMAFVDTETGGFCVDIYEVSAGEKCSYNNPSNQDETRRNLNEPDCIPVSKEGEVPWRNISQTQAITACAKVGKRLPTNKEWFQAALGTADDKSEWGAQDCNVSKNWKISEPGLTGTSKQCVSFVGAYDMVGNVWEWVQDTVKNGSYDGIMLPESGYVQASDEAGIPIITDSDNPDPNYNNDRFWNGDLSVAGMFRGGYWGGKADVGIYSVYAQMPPSFTAVGVGFRCVK